MNILFFSSDGKLGDAVLHTALVKGIKDSYPEANIYCTTAGSTTEFWNRDPRIKESWPFWKLSFWQTIKLGLTLRKKKLDYIISWNPIKREKIKLLCWLAKPKHGVKIFTVNPDEHASIKEQRVLSLFNCKTDNVHYDVYVPKQSIFNWEKNALFLNIFASTEPRSISASTAIKIIDKLYQSGVSNTIYITYFGQNKAIVDDIINQTMSNNVVAVDCESNIEKLISLCASVSAVMTPDTAIVHLASAFNKPIVEFLEKDNALLRTNWGPKTDKCALVEFFNTNEDEDKLIELAIASLSEFLSKDKYV